MSTHTSPAPLPLPHVVLLLLLYAGDPLLTGGQAERGPVPRQRPLALHQRSTVRHARDFSSLLYFSKLFASNDFGFLVLFSERTIPNSDYEVDQSFDCTEQDGERG